MRQLLVTLVQTFYSAPLYARSLRVAQGTGFGWLAFVALLVAVPTVARLHYPVLTEGPEQSAALIAQMPVLHFADGRLSTEPPGPHLIMGDGKIVARIDPGIEGLSDEVERGQLLMTADYFVTLQRNGQIRAHRYDWIGTRAVTHDDLERWWTWWERLGWLVLLPFMFGVGYAIIAVFTLLLSLAALAIARMSGIAAGYPLLLRTTALAATPAILLEAVNDACGRPLALGFWVRAAVTVAFLLFAVRAAQRVPPENAT